ncbi:NAD(P)-binding oxidoreductase [Iodobacter sp. CM08]|uniref:NAD(P)-dependent oxidoreductase n=1 Tax=Iodobacter sp. CM08 TaxID=3085902 RepID=UPI0029821797|nr:NAD(P)-binding oxidoreductase [Iodobacter sp. CM08]MDW5418551.1 NAD(P)-binding oxidoreductase [Iodobacter sp. CM08]
MANPHDVLIFGASRGLGLCLAKASVQRGEKVAAMVRAESDCRALSALGVTLIQGDAFSLADCISALEQTQPRRVISVLGGKNAAGRRIDALGNLNVIQALEASMPATRLLLSTSLGCGEQWDGLAEAAKLMLGEAILAKNEAEQYLKQSALVWMIARPAGLSHQQGTGQYRVLAQRDDAGNYLPRADVAEAMLAILDQDERLYQAWTILGPAQVDATQHGNEPETK